MSGNPLLDAWDRDQRRRTGGGTQGNPLLDAWDRENGTAPPPKADGIVDTVIEKVGDVGSFLAESMGLNFASRNWREERGRTGRAQLDASVNEGVLDKTGSLLERGAASADAGVDTTFGTMLGSKRLLNSAATQRAIGNMPVEGNTSWEDLKANPGIGSLGNFVLDTTTESIPLMMAAAAPWVGIPAVAASGTGNIAQNRADANGGGPVSGKDLAIAAPFGIGSAVLERTGLMGILEAPGKNAATRIARAAGKEGLTEGAQSALEYTGAAAGTNQGFNLVEMFDQAAGGALGGAGMGGSIRGGIELGAWGGRAAQSVVTGRPIPKGVREASGEAGVPLSPEDEASPLPTDLIAQGRGVLADADAMTGANRILGSAGLPSVGERVSIRYPDGRVESGTMADAFADAEFDGEPGVKINLDGGGTLDEHVSTLADAGVSLSRLSREELGAAADAIDADLAARAAEMPAVAEPDAIAVAPSPATAPEQRGFKVADGGKIKPVDNAKAVAEQVFPGARVTSWKRAAGAVGKAGAKSWHVKSGAAIDMAPVKGMTFDQAVQRYRDAGYSIIEAIDETDPATMKKTGATGPHWHFVLGTGGTPAVNTGSSAAVASGERLPLSAEARSEETEPEAPGRRPDLVDIPSVEPGGDLRGEPIDKEWVRFTPESGTLGVPRAAMPQIAAENRGAMVNFLNARGVSHNEDTVPAAELKPTQAEFSADKVMKARDFSGGDRAILVSSDGHVIDGHHQWLAKRDAGEDVRVIRLGATAKELLDIVPEFPSATVDGGAAPSDTGIPEAGSGMADAIGANLRKTLLEKVERGDTTEGGQQSPILQAAKSIRDSGVTVDADMLDQISDGIDAARSGGNFQADMRALVARLSKNAAPAPATKQPKPLKQARPTDAFKFLARAGGITDTEGHDLSDRFGLDATTSRVAAGDRGKKKWQQKREMGTRRQSVFVPGAGPLVREGGMSIDRAGELLHEAGYLSGEDGGRPTIADTIAYLERGMEGSATLSKMLPLDQLSEADAYTPPDNFEDMRTQMFEWANYQGADLTSDDVDQLARLMLRDDVENEDQALAMLVNEAVMDALEDMSYEQSDYADALAQYYDDVDADEGGQRPAPDARNAAESGPSPSPVDDAGRDQPEPQPGLTEPAASEPASVEAIADEFDGAADDVAPIPVSTATMERLREDPALQKAVRAELRKRREQRDAKTPEPQADTPTSAPGRIEDFGETLEGARKHYAAAYQDRMKDASDVDIAAEPLSKSWPDPDYQKLLADGTDPYVVATIRAMRDEVPTKPQKGWKLKGWVDTVAELRAYANALVDGTDDGKAVREFLRNPEGRRIVADLQGRIDLYLALGHEKSLKGISLRYHQYSLYRGEKYDPPLGLYSVEQKAKATAYSNWPRELATGKTREEAIEAFKARLATIDDAPTAKITKFDIYSRRGTPGFIIGKKIGKTYADLKTFDTAKEAREYLRENRAELVKLLEQFRDVPDVRRPSNSPRVGENHRNGADVTPQQFAETFGFRGVQFGNYVEDARRREDLNEAYDALMDMAGVLGVPAKALSLNGELGLAFGARGKGGKGAAAAHYEKGNVVINLTKRGGAGSLAHEWWHALDNYFSRSGGRADSYMTGGSSAQIREAMAEAFRGVNAAIRQTAIKKRSESLDQRRSKPYWSTDIEMSARSFESYIIAKLADNEFANDYLANVVSEEAFGVEGGYPYPTAAEIPAIRAGFDALFQTVEANEADGRVALQSRIEDREPVATLTGDELGVEFRDGDDMPALRTAAIDYYKRQLLGRTVPMADGVPVSFTSRGLRKSISTKGDILLRLVPAIPDILRRGEITWSGPGDRPDISKRIEVAARVQLGDRAFDVFVIVREHSDTRRRQYDLTFDNGYRDESAEGRSSLIDGDDSRGSIGPDEKSPSAELNLRLVEAESNAASVDTVAAARADLQQRLTDYGISDRVALSVGNAILPERVAGEFRAEPGVGRFITIALDTSPDTQFTLDHEVIHAASNMGLFLPPEWRSLEAAARADRAMMGSIRKRYPNLSEEEQVEEAIADRFARWQRGDRERGFVARAFERLRDVLRAIGEALRGNGFTTAESVMRALAGGEIGARQGGTPMAAVEPSDPMAGDDMGTVQKRSIVERADTTRTALARLAGSGSPFSGKMADAFDRWRTAVQDRYLPLLRTQQRVEQQLGRPLAESENPYLGEELLTGRVGAKLENLAENMVEPLFDQMHRDDVSIEELESYLYARHAPERNKRIAEINPEFKNGGGSGMSDIEAAAIINRIEKAGKTAALQRAAAMVDAIRDYALQERIDGGLMSPDEAKAWRETYQNYVPLRGKGDADTEGEADGIRINRSSGINVKGKESRRAFGRRSQADNILAYSLLQAEEAIVRAETNRVAQRFVELARAAPDSKFWAVDKVTRKPVMNETTGIVRYEDQTRIQPEDAPFTVSAKFNGEEHRVTMNRDNASARRLADSMRNLTQQQLDWVTQHLGKVNRFLSAVNTSWNPEFVITNAFRDLQAASINMAGIDVDGLVRRTLKDYPAALAGSMRGAFRVDKGEWGKWYREFTAEGGRVYFNNVEDLAGLKGRIEKEFSRAAARKQGVKMDMLTAKRGFAAVRDFVEAANSGVENAVRLAAYKNAREAGATKAQAASIAKNLTVNFNRRGQMGPAINAAYLFFNASMQGTARILTAMKSPRVRKILAGVVVGGFLIELLNAFLSGTDDDGEAYYDKISDFDKSRNIIIMIPGTEGEHIKIPMPYGYNVFANAGRSLAEVWRRGGDRWQETAGNFVSSVADAFNPIGGTDSILKAIAPTIIDPIVDLEQNSDYSGRPIMPEQNPFESPEPDAQRYFGSVGPHWKAVTDWLTAATGGNDVEPGAIDVSPETLEHLSGVVFGAAGSFIDRNVGLASKLATGEEVEANDFPLVRKVYGEKPGWYDKSAFYDRVGQVEQALAYAKGYIEREDWDRFDTFVGKNEQLLGLEPVTKAANKEMRAIRKARRENDFAREMGQIDDDTWRAGNDAVKEAEKRVIGAYNSAWNGAMLPQRDNGDASR